MFCVASNKKTLTQNDGTIARTFYADAEAAEELTKHPGTASLLAAKTARAQAPLNSPTMNFGKPTKNKKTKFTLDLPGSALDLPKTL